MESQDVLKSLSNKYFYCVDIYKISKDRAIMISDRYYMSDKLLNVPETTVLKRFNNFILVRFITLIKSPQ